MNTCNMSTMTVIHMTFLHLASLEMKNVLYYDLKNNREMKISKVRGEKVLCGYILHLHKLNNACSPSVFSVVTYFC